MFFRPTPQTNVEKSASGCSNEDRHSANTRVQLDPSSVLQEAREKPRNQSMPLDVRRQSRTPAERGWRVDVRGCMDATGRWCGGRSGRGQWRRQGGRGEGNPRRSLGPGGSPRPTQTPTACGRRAPPSPVSAQPARSQLRPGCAVCPPGRVGRNLRADKFEEQASTRAYATRRTCSGKSGQYLSGRAWLSTSLAAI